MENSVKSLHGGNIQLQEARVLISKRDKQVAEFYLRLRNALLNKQKSSGKSEDTCDSESCLNSASSSRRSVNFRTRCEIVAVRHVPDGGCGSIGTALPISGLNYSSAFVPVLENLPELGMGIVDTPDDLVSETGCELTQDLYVSFELSSHDTSEVLIDLTSTSPEKYPYSDQLWGFSDSDPAEVRDFLEDCVETVSKFRRPKNSRPSKVVTINYGLLKAAVITGEVTEALSLIPPVKLLSASHTTVPSTLKHIPEGELFVEQVVHIPAPETLLVNSTLYRRNADLMGQESCNQLSTRYSVAEVPSFSSILEDVMQHVPAVCLAKPLYRRMHLQIEEAYVYCASVYQNYHMKQISISLVDVKFTHLNFKQQGTTLKTSKPVKSSTASNSRVTNIKLAKGNHQFKTLCQNKRLPVAVVKVCDAAKSTSRKLKTRLDADLLKSKEKLSKFELKSLSSTRGTPNVFNSPQLDNFFNVPSTSSDLLAETKDENLYVGVGRGLNEGASELCISEVWSVENSMDSKSVQPLVTNTSHTIGSSRLASPCSWKLGPSEPTETCSNSHSIKGKPGHKRPNTFWKSPSTQLEAFYRKTRNRIQRNVAVHLKDLECPMYIYLKTIGVRDMEGFSDSLKRGADIIEVQKRLFVALNAQLLLMSHNLKKIQLKLFELQQAQKTSSIVECADNSKCKNSYMLTQKCSRILSKVEDKSSTADSGLCDDSNQNNITIIEDVIRGILDKITNTKKVFSPQQSMACLKLSSQDIAVSSQVGAGNSDMANESRVSSSTDEHFKSDVQEVYSLVQDMLSNLDTKLHLHSSASPISADYRQSDESSSTGHLPNESSTEMSTNTVLLAKSLEATYPSETQTSVTSQIQNCESEDSVQQPLARDLAARSFLSVHCDEPPNSNNSSGVENTTTLIEICAALGLRRINQDWSPICKVNTDFTELHSRSCGQEVRSVVEKIVDAVEGECDSPTQVKSVMNHMLFTIDFCSNHKVTGSYLHLYRHSFFQDPSMDFSQNSDSHDMDWCVTEPPTYETMALASTMKLNTATTFTYSSLHYRCLDVLNQFQVRSSQEKSWPKKFLCKINKYCVKLAASVRELVCHKKKWTQQTNHCKQPIQPSNSFHAHKRPRKNRFKLKNSPSSSSTLLRKSSKCNGRFMITHGVATDELQDVDVEGDDGYNTSLPLADHLYTLPESRKLEDSNSGSLWSLVSSIICCNQELDCLQTIAIAPDLINCLRFLQNHLVKTHVAELYKRCLLREKLRKLLESHKFPSHVARNAQRVLRKHWSYPCCYEKDYDYCSYHRNLVTSKTDGKSQHFSTIVHCIQKIHASDKYFQAQYAPFTNYQPFSHTLLLLLSTMTRNFKLSASDRRDVLTSWHEQFSIHQNIGHVFLQSLLASEIQSASFIDGELFLEVRHLVNQSSYQLPAVTMATVTSKRLGGSARTADPVAEEAPITQVSEASKKNLSTQVQTCPSTRATSLKLVFVRKTPEQRVMIDNQIKHVRFPPDIGVLKPTHVTNHSQGDDTAPSVSHSCTPVDFSKLFKQVYSSSCTNSSAQTLKVQLMNVRQIAVPLWQCSDEGVAHALTLKPAQTSHQAEWTFRIFKNSEHNVTKSESEECVENKCANSSDVGKDKSYILSPKDYVSLLKPQKRKFEDLELSPMSDVKTVVESMVVVVCSFQSSDLLADYHRMFKTGVGNFLYQT